MTDKLALAQKLSKILGWDDMLVQVALPTLNAIINQYAFMLGDTYGVSAEEIDANLEKDMLKLDGDKLFRLAVEDYCEDYNPDPMICELRGEIEHEMRDNHLPFAAAVIEWYK